jgi:hydroxyethylthiazole kinase-like uncharacterized protein yjeF
VNLYGVAAVRAAERDCGVPEGVLIDRASTAVARRAALLMGGTYGRNVLVFAGPGHNGADALWAAAKLAARGAAVDVKLPLGEPRDEHGREPLRRLRRAPRVRMGDGYDLTIDGVLGVGARLWPDDDQPEWTYEFDAWKHGPVLAVDVPSGVDADTGHAPLGAVWADVTVTFGAKTGLYVGRGATLARQVEVADIGLRPVEPAATLVTALRAGHRLPDATGERDKYRSGVVGVVAGSERYPGAALLACRGAMRMGCGYVRLVAPRAVADAVRAAYPEVVAVERGGELPPADAWVVGPGLGDEPDLVAAVLATGKPTVVDADAIALADRAALRPDVVLTPHTGEFERLTGVPRADAERDRVGAARKAATDLGAVVLLKGTRTVVATPEGRAFVNPTGTAFLGTAGTGDVLAGTIAALFRLHDTAHDAAVSGAWLHGLAARLASGDPAVAITALDVAERLPDAARIALAAC